MGNSITHKDKSSMQLGGIFRALLMTKAQLIFLTLVEPETEVIGVNSKFGELYTTLTLLIEQTKPILANIQQYKGCQEHIRKVILHYWRHTKLFVIMWNRHSAWHHQKMKHINEKVGTNCCRMFK